ncbi:hypothetical protein [Phyllobacterium sp. OV277]|uniref:hypothetical protein n=1 Tax=Phyllobacterium sp. OV277 TaxID=1882772 RepID=UPI00088BA772|nr:hypothetical protein [Phyllobacterium sp. OV277]SDO52184.1 hypothetical protein SAMN05443582_102403 [Phyllobacterium sp. OV277]
MNAGNSIELSELKGLTNRLFDLLEQARIERIPVTQNQYWSVFAADAFALDGPPSPTMGDVWDDWEDLRSEVAGQIPETTTIFWHAFDHLSGLMKAVAYADLQGSFIAARDLS